MGRTKMVDKELQVKKLRNAIGYVRVSTDGQVGDDKYGIDVQKREILTYADEHGYCIVDWKVDMASGASEDRPELDKILYEDVIANPPIEAVIVFKNDRLARNTKLYFYYLYTLEKKNIKLLSTKEEFDEGNDFANIYRALLQFVAEQERKNIALRTGKGRSMKAQFGGYAGGRCPYGYKIENGKLVINEEERPIVELVFRERENGLVMQAIADKLNESGFKTRSGVSFSVSNVRNILDRQPVYEGMYKYGDMDWVKGVHEPILKKAD